jgi:hypothetical protein
MENLMTTMPCNEGIILTTSLNFQLDVLSHYRENMLSLLGTSYITNEALSYTLLTIHNYYDMTSSPLILVNTISRDVSIFTLGFIFFLSQEL